MSAQDEFGPLHHQLNNLLASLVCVEAVLDESGVLNQCEAAECASVVLNDSRTRLERLIEQLDVWHGAHVHLPKPPEWDGSLEGGAQS